MGEKLKGVPLFFCKFGEVNFSIELLRCVSFMIKKKGEGRKIYGRVISE